MKVGFIGLGRMGAPMALNLCRAGYEVNVYDIREAQISDLVRHGARGAQSAAEAADGAEIIELAVVDDPEVEQLLIGEHALFEHARPESIIAIHSTVLPATVKKLAAIAKTHQINILDAPVSGGETGAREKNLCYMVGGDPTALQRCRPIFATSASHIFHMGDVGSGATAKMIVQMLTCIHMLAAHEAEIMCEASGVGFSALQKVLSVSSAQSFVSDHWLERFKRSEDPLSIRSRRAEVFQKSLAPALDVARCLGLTLEGASLAERLLPRIMGIEKS